MKTNWNHIWRGTTNLIHIRFGCMVALAVANPEKSKELRVVPADLKAAPVY